MKLSEIDKQVIANLHSLPLDKQQSILEFSTFLKVQIRQNRYEKDVVESKPSNFLLALHEFLKEDELDPIDIDTTIFDRDRAQAKDREIDL